MNKLILRAFIFGVCAFIAVILLLGLPKDYGSLGRATPYPLAIMASISAVISSFLLSYSKIIPRLDNFFIRCVFTGIGTVILAHIILGPISYFYGLATSPFDISFMRLLRSIGQSTYTLIFGFLTIPIGIIGGLVSEFILENYGTTKSIDSDSANGR